MSASDHHHPLPGRRRAREPDSPGTGLVTAASPSRRHVSKKPKTALPEPSGAPAAADPRNREIVPRTLRDKPFFDALNARHLDNDQTWGSIIQNLTRCSQAVSDIALMVGAHAVKQGHKQDLVQLVAATQALGQWAQTALAAFGQTLPAVRVDQAATSAAPAPSQPQPQPPTHTASPPAPRATTGAPRTTPKAQPTPSKGAPTHSHNKQPSRPPRQSRRPASTRPRSSTRLIVRYDKVDFLRGRPRPHPATLVDSLNSALTGELVAAISYTQRFQLVLHSKAPFTAEQLAAHGEVIRRVLRVAFALEEDPPLTFETDEVWSKLVVHRVPLPVRNESQDKMHINKQMLLEDICVSNGFEAGLVRRMHFLCHLEEEEERFRKSTPQSPQYLSVLLSLSDAGVASRLLRNGVFWQSTHCRVSQYRSRLY